MSPKPLPVPDLQETVDRTVHAASALLEPEQLQQFEASGRDFLRGSGADLQQRLVDFAHAQDAVGGSYLSRDWLRSYLTTRTPLPLTTSVAFQLAGFPLEPGMERAADFLHRAAVIHLQQLRGETSPKVDPRGHHLDMAQWQVLAPGIRHPLPGQDELRRPVVDPREVQIGVLLNGRLFTMPITDNDGDALPPAVIAVGLEQVLDLVDPASGETSVPGASFGDLSYLGSQVAGEVLAELVEDPANAAVYEQLTRMLFVANVLPGDTSAETPSDLERLQALAFQLGHGWVYKPVTYEIALDSQWLGIHFEHSGADGATVRAAVDRMRHIEPTAGAGAAGRPIRPVELAWRYTGEQRRHLEAACERYRRDSAGFAVHQVSVDRPHIERLPMKVSEDAAQQFLLTYAQLATFGRVRAAYESVDMREFQAGRTECLRPVTPEAVAFAAALLDGEATLEQCAATMEAHRNWVKTCKTGRGFDRHLLGLELMVPADRDMPQFLESHGRSTVSQDFLSTTSLGEAEPISRYVFAPAASDTLGVGYVKYADHYEYVINHHAQQAGDVREFAQNIRQAARAMSDFIRQHAGKP